MATHRSRVVVPTALGAAAGALAATLWFSLAGEAPPTPLGLSVAPPPAEDAAPAEWRPSELQSPCGWSYLRIDESGWSTGEVGAYADLAERLGRTDDAGRELVVPIFPSVFTPVMDDKLYYDAILASDIAPGNKVLVIGAGSGADAWAASLKTGGPIHVIDINPMAVANTRATARLAGFEVKPIVGDIRHVDLPAEFAGFDYVLWNMPFVEGGATPEGYERRDHHDGDNGAVLAAFLARLPNLLAADGVAIVLNDLFADRLVTLPGVTRTRPPADAAGHVTPVMLFTIPRSSFADAAAPTTE